ncbi:MAG: ATP phosphoribosyltransferase regulatory subunit [Hyphomicrobiaceae bacterium]
MTGTAEGDELAVSARWIEALDRQSVIMMAIFARAGFEPVAPAVIQPADVFLDLIGEDLRGRTYVFSDPSGAELCLRPDLTIPACRLYLARHGAEAPASRFAYNGVVFRYQPTGGNLVRPREFRQAGIESFAADDPGRADAEILALSVEAVRAAGLRAFKLRVGDLGIFDALLEAVEMPDRWRVRLRHHFRHPDAFRRQLRHIVQPNTAGLEIPDELLRRLTAADENTAIAEIEAYCAAHDLTITGTRTLEEIAAHLKGIGEDLQERPLSKEAAGLIDAYLRVEAPARAAMAQIRSLTSAAGIDVSAALDAYEARIALAAQEGIEMGDAHFSASFGRAFAYYTGFVFEITSSALGDTTPIGGGGRYDTLMETISGAGRVPAVGAAIHSERLLLAVRGGRP